MIFNPQRIKIINKVSQRQKYAYTHTKTHNYKREYFYFIDFHGQLFLEETTPKNFTTCFKDPKFLNFFFKRIRYNSKVDNNYSYLSPCGVEINFIKSEDSPIVFHDLIDSNDNLKWGGNFEFPFQPDKLSVCTDTGRVYHPLPFDLESPIHRKALVKSSLLLTKLASAINFEDMTITWKGNCYPIELIQPKNVN